MANGSVASLRRYQKMNYAAHNALRIPNISQANIILYRHVARPQRNSFPSVRFRTLLALRNRYNRHRVTATGNVAGLIRAEPETELRQLNNC